MIGSPRQNIEQPLWGGSNCSSPWSCFIISKIIMFSPKIWPSLSALIWTCITFSNCSSSATTMMFARELLATNPTWCHRDHADRKSDFYGTSISPLPGCLWCKYQWRAPRPPSRQCGIWTYVDDDEVNQSSIMWNVIVTILESWSRVCKRNDGVGDQGWGILSPQRWCLLGIA